MTPGVDANEAVMASRVQLRQGTILVAAIAAISLLRYVTGPAPSLLHELSLRLYYVPILLGAYWYGVGGGLIVAVVSSVAYVNRVSEIASTFDPARLAEVAIFHLVAIVVGLLANAQRRANTRLRESYEEIRRIDRLRTLGEVAAGLAHELRHPLASIGGALEILESRSKPGTPESEFSRIAMSEVQRLDKLVWEFLRYARPHEPELRETSVADVVQQTLTLLSVEAERAGVQVHFETPDSRGNARIDPLQIEQVLLNVVLNAIQASPPGSRVTIRQESRAGAVCIDVDDQGSGIPAEHVTRIFDPFFTTREKGTGLGLSIAHRIVHAHGGRLEVARTSATGTRIRLLLPASGPAPSPVPAVAL